MIKMLLDWFWAFAKGIGAVWDWLTTPINFGGLLETDVAPIYAVVGSIAIIGLIRRIL